MATSNSTDTTATQNLWGSYLAQIATSQGIDPDDLVLAGTSTPANFYVFSKSLANPPSLGETNALVYNLGDQLLTPTGLYTPAEQSFFSDYVKYINALQPTGAASQTPAQTKQIAHLQKQLGSANGTLTSDQQNAFNAWQSSQALYPGKYPTFSSFLNGTSWGSIVQGDQNALTGITSQLSTLYTTIYGADYNQIQADQKVVNSTFSDMLGAQTATAPNEMLISTNAGMAVAPTYFTSSLQAFSTWLDNAVAGKGESITVSLNSSSGSSAFSSSSQFSRTNWSEDFFFYTKSETSSSGGSAVSFSNQSSGIGISVKLKAVTTLTLTPGPWYQSALMGGWANPTGLLLINELLIGIVDTVVVSFASAADTQTAQTAYNTSGFGVGIFFGAHSSSSSGSNSAQYGFTFDATNNTLTITNTSNVPVILAYNTSALPNSATPNSL